MMIMHITKPIFFLHILRTNVLGILLNTQEINKNGIKKKFLFIVCDWLIWILIGSKRKDKQKKRKSLIYVDGIGLFVTPTIPITPATTTTKTL